MINKILSNGWQVKGVLYGIAALLLSGCATKMVVTPDLAGNADQSNYCLAGEVRYEGNRDYLPRTIKEEVTRPGITFKYEYHIAYGRDQAPQVIPLFNPLTIIGFPIGENTMVVSGDLTILKSEEIIKVYSATCGLEKVRSIFSEGETFSDLRKKGLFTVRDCIELQMCQDKDFLSSLVSKD